jgi:hypothetical protein
MSERNEILARREILDRVELFADSTRYYLENCSDHCRVELNAQVNALDALLSYLHHREPYGDASVAASARAWRANHA